jgi:hypothetical protein
MDSLPKNYAEMVTSIQDAHVDANDDFTARLPEIVARGELMVQRDLDLTIFDTSIATETIIDDPVIDKPDNMVRENSIAFTVDGRRRTLKKRSLEFVRQFQDAVLETPVYPEYYADSDDDSWEVAPIPDTSVEIIVHAVIRAETIADRRLEVDPLNQTTWISIHQPDLLWQAVNYHACLYLKKWRLAADAKEQYRAILPQARAETASQRRHDPEDLHSNRVHQNAPAPAAPVSET